MIIPSAKRLDAVCEYYFSRKLRQLSAMEEAGRRVINLGIGNPDMAPPLAAQQILSQTAQDCHSHGYQPYGGTEALRLAMAQWYERTYAVALNEDQVLPLLGSKEGITHISLAFLNPGDEALVPDPGYLAYRQATRLAGGQPVAFDLSEQNDWLPDLSALAAKITPRTRLLWLNYPHMPSGATASDGLFAEILKLAREHRILVCHDNPYSLVLNPNQPTSILSQPDALDGCLELNSLSKSHNMAGWRVGMVLGHQEYLHQILKVKSNMDSGMFLPIQEAAIAAMAEEDAWHDQRNQRYLQRRLLAWRLMDTLGFSYKQDCAGMFVWARAPESVTDVTAFLDQLLDQTGVFLTPGRLFGQNGSRYARVSLCASDLQLQEATQRVEDFVGVSS